MRVLVTGGAGYIGTHTLIELIAAGHEPLVVDSFANSVPEALVRTGELVQRTIPFAECDVRERAALRAICADFNPEAVIHFAGLKAVGESEERPRDYYDVNVSGTLNLLAALEGTACKRIVFSSSATVYGVPQYLPYDEAHPCAPASVYAKTKHMAENILTDWQCANPQTAVTVLRYFNPVGAHGSARIGEDPQGIPNNLMPFIAQVAVGRRDRLMVFGDDYDTPDGTGVRDYIHVSDLARAHVAALGAAQTGTEVFNIGTGTGYSVLDMIGAFEKAAGCSIPYRITGRRAGDIAAMQADASRAADLLGWRAELGLAQMCASTWHWQRANPQGYNGE
ncbi:UDP-glucose 4-epimerase GalE [Sulfitobacter sp. F26169L]|uniref:UDP-glucose 4-epimerase GalE n=1 Tax=Sulfitobacter sp. F26169L TaxID=2996015 RepID=UPI002260F068|nr:UDP-glucose 4-epimerase GalE [Sulfitobacter sp. F26169L]MCX7568010.1 UDP-glucose 4-epimerase GalE [Sulfitobacter sp. F26169L]